MSNEKVVLVVEDDLAVNKALVAICKMRGWQTRSALTIASAMNQLTPPPCCIVLDLMLPDGDGETVLREVRRRKDNTKVIVTTGSLDRARIQEVEELSDCFMHKPVDGEALLQAIGQFMEG